MKRCKVYKGVRFIRGVRFINLQAEVYNFAKSETPPYLIFMFFKL